VAKVYVSSTKLDLEPERAAAIAWLIQAGHQPVHSYVADTQTVRLGCLQDVCKCDAYVLILGFRYGFVPEDDNRHGRSITELEYEEAIRVRLPVVALQAVGARDVSLTDLGKPEYAKVEDFAGRVNQKHRVCLFRNEADLIAGLSSGLQRALRADHLPAPDHNQIGKLYLADAKKTRLLVTQSITVLWPQCLEAVNRISTAGDKPDADTSERAVAQALRENNTKLAATLLERRQNEIDARLRAATEGPSARIERRFAAQLARDRGALAMAKDPDPSAALAAYEQAANYDPEDQSAWTTLGHLYILLSRLDDAEEAFERAAKLAPPPSVMPVGMTEFRTFR
jgi:tetratricopeptide (TPR) repeat protein